MRPDQGQPAGSCGVSATDQGHRLRIRGIGANHPCPPRALHSEHQWSLTTGRGESKPPIKGSAVPKSRCSPASRSNTSASGGPRSAMAPGSGQENRGHQRGGYPVTSAAGGVASWGVGATTSHGWVLLLIAGPLVTPRHLWCGPVERPTAPEGAPPLSSRRTKRTTVRPSSWIRGTHTQLRALAAPHPGRSPGSPDRSHAADAGGPSCYPGDLPKGYHTASRGHVLLHTPDPLSGPLDTARSG
jgi:hypothetical protein